MSTHAGSENRLEAHRQRPKRAHEYSCGGSNAANASFANSKRVNSLRRKRDNRKRDNRKRDNRNISQPPEHLA